MSTKSNVFIIINLGCEMIYVIEQRLKAQKIPDDKATQVMRDITSVLLDPKIIERLLSGTEQGNSLVTFDHCKFIINDIACCSLMRLDSSSMTKLWDLMTMIFKWQLFVSKYHHHLLEITFRHLDGIGQLYPEMEKTILIDYTKNTILDYWNQETEIEQRHIYATTKNWLECCNIKISILIRLGFQGHDGYFIPNCEESYFKEFAETIGDNIYNKSVEIAEDRRNQEIKESSMPCAAGDRFEKFVNQLNVVVNDIDVKESKHNIVLDDLALDLTACEQKETQFNKAGCSGFVQLETSHNNSKNSWETFVGGNQKRSIESDLKTFLNRK